MSKFLIALLLFPPWLAPAQQPVTSFSGKVSIPVQLLKTVRADKVHPGDPVEFKSLEAVLVGKDLVMPVNSSLHGRVLTAGPKQDGKNSWLAVVVERAEWKDHSLPLHAFISAQIAISTANHQHAPDATPSGDLPASPRAARRQNARVAARSDPTLSNMVKSPQDASEVAQDESGTKHPSLEDVGILRDKDGTTYLLSSKSHVKLPAGVLLMLSGNWLASPEAALDRTVTTSSTQPQF